MAQVRPYGRSMHARNHVTRGCIALAALLALLALGTGSSAQAALSLPSGFEERTIASGFDLPTGVAWAPDGRMFVVEKKGKVKVVNPGGSVQTLLDLTGRVNSYTDRGLLGVAVDAEFATNRFVYIVYYYDPDPANVTGPKVGRLSRLTVNPDNTLENPSAPERVLLGSVTTAPCPPPANGNDCIPGEGASHGIGTIRADADGTLWLGTGDAAHEPFRTYNPQSLAGKILHVDRDGRGLPSNPYCPGTTDLDSVCSKVFAMGFRNPFRFWLRDGGKGPAVGDVGQSSREEWNLVRSGRNYGWICYEGDIKTPGFVTDGRCRDIYSKEGTADGVTWPSYTYSHDGVGGSIIAGPQYTGDAYPSGYRGDFFIGDYVKGWIRQIDVNADDTIADNRIFASSGFGAVDFTLAPSGNLAYVDIGWGGPGTGRVREIVYAPGNGTPTARATATPTAGRAPMTVAFDGTASSDPDGDALSYRWSFGDGSPVSTAAAPSHTYTADGQYTARLTVDDGRGRQDETTVRITVGNTRPTARILAPTDGDLFTAGGRVELEGEGSDAEDGDLPDGAFRWNVVMHHGNSHIHDLGEFSGRRTGFVTNDDHGEDSFYEIRLTVTDAEGLSDTRVTRVYPRTVKLYLHSHPVPGAKLTYGSTEKPTPWVADAAMGFRTRVAAETRFLAHGRSYVFERWDHGGEQAQDFTVPGSPVSLVARYRLEGFVSRDPDNGALRYFGGEGEDNDLTVAQGDGTITFTEARHTIYAGPGCTQVTPAQARCPDSNADVNIHAREGDDRVVVQGQRRVAVFGGDGADTIVGGAGADYITGGAGDDVVEGGDGTDHLEGNDGADRLDGGAGADLLSGDAGDDVLLGGAGDDLLIGGAGADDHAGGEGTDRASYVSHPAGVKVTLDELADDGSAGERDRVRPDVEHVLGSDFADELTGSDGGNYLEGRGGDDRLAGGGGNDHLAGGAGADRLAGGTGQDFLDGGAGADELLGEDGNDVLDGGTGSDVMSGGAGVDRVSYVTRTAPVDVRLDGAANDGEAGENDRAGVGQDVEDVAGGAGNDVLIGNAQTNWITGGNGNDHLNGAAGNDQLDGGAGDDHLYGGAGNDHLRGDGGNDIIDGQGDSDTIRGGEGTDIATYATRSAPVVASLDGSYNDGEAGEHDNVTTDVEGLRGGSAADVLTGNDAANQLEGNGGADTLNGLGGDDFVSGGAGDDRLSGGDGNDVLRGHDGADGLDGGAGDDVLDGGLGADVLAGGAGADRVTYQGRTAPVTVTLDGLADDGEAGERDEVRTDVENVTGGAGPDLLTGDAGINIIEGGPGDDRIDGGAGVDFLLGGDGADTVTSRDLFQDTVACGAGTDGAIADHRDSVAADCESVDRADPA
jgi:Ca2+-binding RTX toxin-like protein